MARKREEELSPVEELFGAFVDDYVRDLEKAALPPAAPEPLPPEPPPPPAPEPEVEISEPPKTRSDFRRVPRGSRRTWERENSGGYPGLCTNAEGLYIGGVGNDCRHYRPEGSPLCEVHRGPDPPEDGSVPKRKRKGGS